MTAPRKIQGILHQGTMENKILWNIHCIARSPILKTQVKQVLTRGTIKGPIRLKLLVITKATSKDFNNISPKSWN